jgi:hypothetical protein
LISGNPPAFAHILISLPSSINFFAMIIQADGSKTAFH